MSIFPRFIKKVRASGKQYFTIDEAQQEMLLSRNAVRIGLARLKKQGDLISPAKGLYVIVPPEQQHMGCIPAPELIPILMSYWDRPYYVGLLTAALYHGATHQKPGAFQIIVNRQMKRYLQFGRISIECIYKKQMNHLPVQNRIVGSGYLFIASPELTVFDLFFYLTRSGGLNHVATVLSELIEVIDREKLVALAKIVSEKMWLQRFGYVLEHIVTDHEEKKIKIIRTLNAYMSDQTFSFVPLAPELPVIGASRCYRWKIIENTTVESDE